MSTMQQTEERLLSVLASCRRWIPPNQIASMAELVRAGEPGVALENLCTQLYEYFVNTPDDVLRELTILASELGIKREYVDLLRESG